MFEGDGQILRSGFLRAILMTLRLKQDGLLTAGCPCSSFVFVNLATSARSSTSPYGEESMGYVFDANHIACRMVLLLLIATCRAAYFKVEQPSSSKLFMLPFMLHLELLAKKICLAFFNSF